MLVFDKVETAEGYKISVFEKGAINLSNGRSAYNIVYSPSFSIFPSGLDFIGDVTKGVYFELIIKNDDFSDYMRIKSTDLAKANEKVFSSYGFFKKDNGNISFLCLVDSIGTGRQDLLVTEFDTGFNVINRKIIPEPRPDILEYRDAEILKNGDIYLLMRINGLGQQGLSDKSFFVLDSLGDLLFGVEPLKELFSQTPNLGGILDLSNSFVVVQPEYIMDKINGDIHCQFDNGIGFQNGSMVGLSDTSFLFCGTTPFGSLSEQYIAEVIMKGYSDCSTDTFFHRVLQRPPLTLDIWTDFEALSIADSNHIYFLTSRDGFFLDDFNMNITINSLNETGSLRWSYLIGGDASYTPLRCHPLPDGSVLVLILKYVVGDALTIQYVHFSEDGQVLGTSGNINPEIVREAAIYPNPVYDILNIEVSPRVKNAKLYLYDTFGRTVLFRNIDSNISQIEVSDLPKGAYFYNIESDGNFINSGKLLKY